MISGNVVSTLAAIAVLTTASCGDDGAATETGQGMSPASYDRFRQPDRLLAAFALEPGDVVADVGAGRGYLTFRLADAVGADGAVVATDIDPSAIAELRRLAARRRGGAPVDVRLVTPDDPGLESGRFDLVVLAQVDHLLEDRVDTLRALRPALAVDGMLAVSNRRTHRGRLLEAAKAAGYSIYSEPADLPGQYLVLLKPH